MTKTKGLLLSVLVSTLLSTASFAQELPASPTVVIFPTPSDRELTISFDHHGDGWDLQEVSIYDLLGQLRVKIYGNQFKCEIKTPETEIRHRLDLSNIKDFQGNALAIGIYPTSFLYLDSDGKPHGFTTKIIYASK